jgi:methylated-DNA-[protein]-cysteine S-methyltransferase
MDSKISINMSSSLGNLVLEIEAGKLVSLSISQDKDASAVTDNSEKGANHKQLQDIKQQLNNYFSIAKPISTATLLPGGTRFQKSVWKELCKIPLGETRTYGEIAKKLNSSARAVGNACRKNPIAIIVPCHRVVSATGIGGYAGKTEGKQLNIKRWLLKHEGVNL